MGGTGGGAVGGGPLLGAEGFCTNSLYPGSNSYIKNIKYDEI